MEDEKMIDVSIPASLYRSIESRIKDAGFESVSSYVTYVLREILSDDEEDEGLTEEDEEKVRERLRSLGYMD